MTAPKRHTGGKAAAMKLLVACDDGTDVQVIVDDLRRAGLGAAVQAVVLSVADLLPVPAGSPTAELPAAARRARERAARALEDARRTAAAAVAVLLAAFPDWTVSDETIADAPAWAIVKKTEKWRPNLIVVGAQDRSAAGRFWLGSVSQSVVLHADRSVRIVRPRAQPSDAPQRLLLGFDGSPGAQAAAAQVAARTWRPRCHVRVVTALDALLASTLEDAENSDGERAAAGRLAERGAVPLHAAGLDVSTAVIEGAPKRALIEEAEAWEADCVFVGARGLRGAERFLLGGVSAAVAARASCTVEVVRG